MGFFADFMAGAIAAGVSKLAAAPVERMKQLEQNAPELVALGRLDKGALPLNAAGAAALIFETGGLTAFFRSQTFNILRYFPTQMFNFAFKGAFRDLFPVQRTDSVAVKLVKNIISGGMAGAFSLLFVFPLDVIGTRLACDVPVNGEYLYSGFFDCLTKTVSQNGVLSLYTGFIPSVWGIVIYRGAYFGLYDTMVQFVGTNRSYAASFCLGWGVTVLAGLATYPLDTVRRRMFVNPAAYSGFFDCVIKSVSNDGFSALFAGAKANIIRGFIGAFALVMFDSVRDSMKPKKGDKK